MSVNTEFILPDNFLELFVSTWATMRSYKTDVVHGSPAAFRHDTLKDWEYFLHDPTPEIFEEAATRVKESTSRILTVITNDFDKYNALAIEHELDALVDPETLMVINLSQEISKPTDDEFVATLEPQDGYTIVKFTSDGTLAASGQVRVSNNVAVFDRIATVPEFRRRGLGKRVMNALALDAINKGAHTGLLLASEDGHKLYTNMGWSSKYRVLILGNAKTNILSKKKKDNGKEEGSN